MKFNLIKNKPFSLAISYFTIGCSVVILYHFDPATSSGIYPPSLSRELGGFYCAGCGTLRGLHQLLHGNFQAALDLNPLLFIALPYLIYWFVAYNLKFFKHINLPIIIWHKKQIFWLSLTIVLYGLMRNINIYPFSWLAP